MTEVLTEANTARYGDTIPDPRKTENVSTTLASNCSLATDLHFDIWMTNLIRLQLRKCCVTKEKLIDSSSHS